LQPKHDYAKYPQAAEQDEVKKPNHFGLALPCFAGEHIFMYGIKAIAYYCDRNEHKS
jgi:hypothetical protein